MKNKVIVVTGSTGAFGQLLTKKLLNTNAKLILLVRAQSQRQAKERITKIFELNKNQIKKVIVIKSDLAKHDLGLKKEDYKNLTKSTTHILHSAANTRFNLKLKDAISKNVTTTKNILKFASQCKNLDRFAYLSTAFVAGKRSGIILEKELEHKAGFINTYQHSKYKTEKLVRIASQELPVTIFRPSLIATHINKNDTSPISALDMALTLVGKGLLPVLPGGKNNHLDVIDGNTAAELITKLFLKKKLKHLTYHITKGRKALLLENFLNTLEQSSKKLQIKFCGNIENFNIELGKLVEAKPELAKIYTKTQSFLPELAYPKIFDNRNLLSELVSGKSAN